MPIKKHAPFVLAAICVGLVYLYFTLAKEVKHMPNHQAIITNHWTGEVKHCVIAPDKTQTCRPREAIAVPWYMAIVQHTVESFN